MWHVSCFEINVTLGAGQKWVGGRNCWYDALFDHLCLIKCGWHTTTIPVTWKSSNINVWGCGAVSLNRPNEAEMGEPSKLDGTRACVQDTKRMEKEVLSVLRRRHFSSFLEMGWAERLLSAYTRLSSTWNFRGIGMDVFTAIVASDSQSQRPLFCWGLGKKVGDVRKLKI